MTIPLTGWPDIKVEIAPGYTPLTVSPTWVDVTDLVAWQLTMDRGRFGSTDRAKVGSLSVTFDDPTRILDSSNTGSTHYPYIRPRLPVRFRATYSAVSYPLWRGHLTRPGHTYPPDGDHTSTFDCVDLFAVMATVDTSQRSAFASTVELFQPVAWWRLGDEGPVEGVEATDEMGAHNGIYRGDDGTSVDGLVDDDQSGAFNAGLNGWVQLPQNLGLAVGSDNNSLVARVNTPPIGGSIRTLFKMVQNPTATPWEATLAVEAAGTPGVVSFVTNAPLTSLSSTTRIDDSLPHTVVVACTTNSIDLYVDGVLEDSDSTVGVSTLWSDGITDITAGIGRYPTGAVALHADSTVLDEVVMLPVTLTAAQALDIHEAAVDSWAGETTGDRIERAAGLAEIPAGLLDLDTGVSTVVAWSGGSSTIDIAQKTNETEQGILVVSGDGKLTFEDRHAHLTDTPAATFGDSGSDLTYASHATEQGEHLIVNRATFSSDAGSATAEDAPSRVIYGLHDERRTTLDNDRGNLAGGAQFLVARSAGPEERIVGLEVDPMVDPTNLWPQVLGRDIGDRITVNRTPEYGPAISQVVQIVGVRHTIRQDSWRTFWALTSADTAEFAISDISLSDGPALAAF